jgi:hypothetical protein
MKSNILRAITVACLLGVLIARGCTAATLPGYPAFSWDKVPQFAFLSLAQQEGLSDENAKSLAQRFSIITICKHNPRVAGKTTELETIRAARKIKAINPGAKVLFYWNSALAQPGSSAIAVFAKNPLWALKDDSGQLVLVRLLKVYDVSNPKLRDWWSGVCGEIARNPVIDGVFADAVAKFGMTGVLPGEPLKPERHEALAEGVGEMLRLAQRKMGSGKLLIYNGLRGKAEMWRDGGARYLECSSGAMVEHFAALSGRDARGRINKDQLARDIELIGKAASEGKIVLVKGWPGEWSWLSKGFDKLNDPQRRAILRENITFPLAAFLIAAEEHCYFSYTFGYLSGHGLFEHLEELNKPLGPPNGKAQRTGWKYHREYKHASVSLDIEKEQARIEWH